MTSEIPTNDLDRVALNKSRLTLLLIMGIPVTMILTATWLWYFVVQGDLDLVGKLGTSNRGTLVQPPRQIDEFGLSDRDGRDFSYTDVDRRWTLLVPYSGPECDARCEATLYVTRQIHTAMGKELPRIRRMYVANQPLSEQALAVDTLSDERPAPSSLEAYFDQQQRGLIPLYMSGADFDVAFSEYLAARDTWYLVDPAGWIMMSYSSEVTYKDVISDLKFLLKNSSE
ncbi:MAG: hypothetical protein ABJ056_07465 [Halioglobus sp.]